MPRGAMSNILGGAYIGKEGVLRGVEFAFQLGFMLCRKTKRTKPAMFGSGAQATRQTKEASRRWHQHSNSPENASILHLQALRGRSARRARRLDGARRAAAFGAGARDGAIARVAILLRHGHQLSEPRSMAGWSAAQWGQAMTAERAARGRPAGQRQRRGCRSGIWDGGGLAWST